MLVLGIIVMLIWITFVILAMNSSLAIIRLRRLVIALEASCVLATFSTSGWSGKISVIVLAQFVAIFVFLTGLYVAAGDGEFDRKAKGTELMVADYPRTINNLSQIDKAAANKYAVAFLWLSIIFSVALVILRYILIFPDYESGALGFFVAMALVAATIMTALTTPAEIEEARDGLGVAGFAMFLIVLAPLITSLVVGLAHLSSFSAYNDMDKDVERATMQVMETTYWLRPVDECAYFDPDSRIILGDGEYSAKNYDSSLTYYLIDGRAYEGKSTFDVYYFFSSDDAELQYIDQSQVNLWFDDGATPQIVKREQCYNGNLSGRLFIESTEYNVYIPNKSCILQ